MVADEAWRVQSSHSDGSDHLVPAPPGLDPVRLAFAEVRDAGRDRHQPNDLVGPGGGNIHRPPVGMAVRDEDGLLDLGGVEDCHDVGDVFRTPVRVDLCGPPRLAVAAASIATTRWRRASSGTFALKIRAFVSERAARRRSSVALTMHLDADVDAVSVDDDGPSGIAPSCGQPGDEVAKREVKRTGSRTLGMDGAPASAGRHRTAGSLDTGRGVDPASVPCITSVGQPTPSKSFRHSAAARAVRFGEEDLRCRLQCPADRVLLALVEWGSENTSPKKKVAKSS